MNNFLLSMIICLDNSSLDFEFYEKTLREFANSFGYHLQIDGEPFQYKYFEKILDLCERLNIKDIGIRVNEKIDESQIELIRKYNIRSVMFRYDSIYVEENTNLTKRCNFPTEISLIIDKKNIYEIDKIIKWAIKKHINLIVLERGIIAKYRKKSIDVLSKDQYRYIMEKVVKHNHKHRNIGIALSHCPNKILLHKDRQSDFKTGGCSAGIISCAIDINGNIIPCLPLYNVVEGNIKNDSLLQVWDNSETFNKLRNRGLLKGKCGKCTYKNLCGGCRAESLYKKNDLLDEDDTCWNENVRG